LIEDEKLIAGIKTGDRHVLREIYSKYFNSIASYILNNNGSSEDAKDVFQDGIMVLYKKCQDPDFQIKSQLRTYLFGICKNTWLNKLRKKSVKGVPLDENVLLIDDNTLEAEIAWREKERLYRRKFGQMGERCRKIIQLFLEGMTMDEIAKELSLSSPAYAKKLKYKCKSKLINLVRSDASYQRTDWI